MIEGGFFAEFDHPLTVVLARKIVEHIPCAEQVRYVNSGTEGTLLALRRRAATRAEPRWCASMATLTAATTTCWGTTWPPASTARTPATAFEVGPLSAGIPDVIGETLYVIPWHRAEVFAELAKEKGHEIAAILMNPIDYNNGCIGASTEYLQAIRDICDEHGIVLIFDEILSGFRTGISCAKGYYGVTPDPCLLGKALSNRVPLGAIAGKKQIMQKIMDPVDPVVAGGTFSGNLLGCAAGLAAMRIIEQPGFFPTWLRRRRVHGRPAEAFDKDGFPAWVLDLGCNFFIYVGTRDPIRNYHDFDKLNPALAKALFRRCIDKGLYFHTDFTVSACHDEETLAGAAATIRSAAREVKAEMM